MKIKRADAGFFSAILVLSTAFVFAVASVLMALFAPPAVALDAGVSLSYLFVKGEQSVGSIYLERDRWRFEVGMIGSGTADNVYVEEPVRFGSITHRSFLVDNFLGGKLVFDIGVAHVDQHPLVGEMNFKLSTGVRWRRVEAVCTHISSAGIYENNSGLNYCGVGATWRF